MKSLIKPITVAAIALGSTTVGLGVSSAGAAPTNAPSSLQGTFSCDNGDTGTFVVNSGNAQGTTWNGAHLSFDTGGNGIFHPVSINLMISFMGQPQQQIAQKNNTSKGSVTCDITAAQGPFSLVGTVFGWIS